MPSVTCLTPLIQNSRSSVNMRTTSWSHSSANRTPKPAVFVLIALHTFLQKNLILFSYWMVPHALVHDVSSWRHHCSTLLRSHSQLKRTEYTLLVSCIPPQAKFRSNSTPIQTNLLSLKLLKLCLTSVVAGMLDRPLAR